MQDQSVQRTIVLGRTGLRVNATGMGLLPIQRTNRVEAINIIRSAYDAGINFFDTARGYTDSEEKFGDALRAVRDRVVLATKSTAKNGDQLQEDVMASLRALQTDYIDVFQFHNPSSCPKPGDGTNLYETAERLRSAGIIRFIGITNHRMNVATEAAESGLYDTIQYPFSYLAEDRDWNLLSLCEQKELGFIAMKALSGGLITRADIAFAFFYHKAPYALPIWGIQHSRELREFITYAQTPPVLDTPMYDQMEADRKSLGGRFCRGCGYCLPCPQGIRINDCARMSLLLRRAVSAIWLREAWQNEMAKIKTCVHCNQCKKRCPYELDVPALLEDNWNDYQTFFPDGMG